MSKNVGAKLAKSVLGIDTNARYAHQPDNLEERARTLLGSAGIYMEEEPTVVEWILERIPSWSDVGGYFRSLFPSLSWIPRYNLRWLLGDVVAGVTIGVVVVPQAMAYASLAGLTPSYGLYTSFTGAALYWVFGTSKDIVIGTTGVGSLLVGQVVGRVAAITKTQSTSEEITHTLSLLCGSILLFFGLFRLGWLIEFIPYIPISAFITAASITILATQIPVAFGIHGVDKHAPPYRVLISSIQGIQRMRIDAALGITSIALLFAIRHLCTRMQVRHPAHKRAWDFASSLRLTFTMLLFTLISFLVNGKIPVPAPRFRIVGPISTGFQVIGAPQPSMTLVQEMLPELPAVVLILVIEHIAIAKAMGRAFNYTINPSQEIVALGAANLFSPFVGGYVCTGSFGGSAVMSKSGVRTPLAGLFTAMMVVLALYALTELFYYIPKATLAGLILHAVCDMATPPRTLYKYWQLSPLEFLIWVACVTMAVFKSLDSSIYLGICLSILLLLIRTARAHGVFVGVARSRRVPRPDGNSVSKSTGDFVAAKDVFLPLSGQDSSNPAILVQTPYPGVFVYRLHDSYNYINQAFHVDALQSHLMENTRRTSGEPYEHESDRPWNERGPRNELGTQHLPCLRALVFDFSAVNSIDITSVQGLIDLRNSMDRYAAPDAVEWHFANVQNRWTRRALATAGFGYPTSQNPESLGRWEPIYSIAPAQDVPTLGRNGSRKRAYAPAKDEESQGSSSSSQSVTMAESTKESATISAVDRPFFHLDLHDAMDAAVRNAQHIGDTDSGDADSGDADSGDVESGDADTGDVTGGAGTGDTGTGDTDTGDTDKGNES